MPKVLHVYRTYFPDPPGGLQEAIRQIAFSTANYGFRNTIYTLSPTPYPKVIIRSEADVVRNRSWLAPASCDIGGLASFITFFRLSKKTDVLHYFFPWPFTDVLHAIVRPEKPVLLTYISDVVRQRWLGVMYEPLMWRTLRGMKIIVANSPAYAETSTILSHPSIKDKVRIIPLGIEESSYPKVEDDGVFERIAIDAKEPFILFLGVLRYYKGLQFLLKAAKNIGAKIVIAGSGPEKERLQALADELMLSNVVFAGQVTNEEKVALLKSCRALVLPSHLRSEAFGMVLVEASMFKKPLISCEIGTGTSYVNEDEVTGFVVPPESPEALSQAMNTLLTNEQLAVQMGEAARTRYENLFSGQVLGKAYAELFRELGEMESSSS